MRAVMSAVLLLLGYMQALYIYTCCSCFPAIIQWAKLLAGKQGPFTMCENTYLLFNYVVLCSKSRCVTGVNFEKPTICRFKHAHDFLKLFLLYPAAVCTVLRCTTKLFNIIIICKVQATLKFSGPRNRSITTYVQSNFSILWPSSTFLSNFLFFCVLHTVVHACADIIIMLLSRFDRSMFPVGHIKTASFIQNSCIHFPFAQHCMQEMK